MTAKKKRILLFFFSLVFILALIAIDQFTKHLAVLHLMDQDAYVLIPGVFELRYLENHGAAFGMLQNRQLLFVFIAALMLVFAVYFLFKVPIEKKYTIPILLGLLIVAGGIGNTIDRMLYSYVIDFLYFRLIDFPIFNVADMYVTVSTILLFFYILFFMKDDDLTFLKLKIRKDN
ncbi:MAG: signal peptidase II [Lachnospiraceae bacterium]|nr:signal peptidase II [Lachnospiraceae bacterium]